MPKDGIPSWHLVLDWLISRVASKGGWPGAKRFIGRRALPFIVNLGSTFARLIYTIPISSNHDHNLTTLCHGFALYFQTRQLIYRPCGLFSMSEHCAFRESARAVPPSRPRSGALSGVSSATLHRMLRDHIQTGALIFRKEHSDVVSSISCLHILK